MEYVDSKLQYNYYTTTEYLLLSDIKRHSINWLYFPLVLMWDTTIFLKVGLENQHASTQYLSIEKLTHNSYLYDSESCIVHIFTA